MPKLLKWLIAPAVLLLGFALIVVLTSSLRADAPTLTVEPAATRPEAFEALKDAINRGDLGSDQYVETFSGDASRYSFVTYTAEASSFCLLPSEWTLIGLTPLPGDVALVRGEPCDIAPMGRGTVSATLLTTNENSNATRSMWLEYYVFGAFKSVVLTRRDAS